MTVGLSGRHLDKIVARATTGSHRVAALCNGLLVVSPSCGTNVSLNRDDDIVNVCDLAGSASELVRLKDIVEEWPVTTQST